MKSHAYRFSKIAKWLGPHYFSALHVGKEYAHYITLVRKEYDLALSFNAQVRIHKGAINAEGLQNENALTTALRELYKKAPSQRVVLVVPSSVHTNTFGTKEMKKEKDLYKRAATRAGFRVMEVMYEEHALTKKIGNTVSVSPEVFVHVGAMQSDVALVARGNVVGGKKSAFGGESLTYLLSRTFKMDVADAETIKREKGLKVGSDGKVLSVVSEAAHFLKDDIERAYLAWYTQMKKVSGSHETVSKIVLFGSESMIPGLAEYLSHGLRMKVDYMDAWQGILDIQKNLPHLSKRESLDYIYALGGVMSQL